jgi:hypothetical protein
MDTITHSLRQKMGAFQVSPSGSLQIKLAIMQALARIDMNIGGINMPISELAATRSLHRREHLLSGYCDCSAVRRRRHPPDNIEDMRAETTEREAGQAELPAIA